MTALDKWFLICIIFVAMAMFEYATLMSINFGKLRIYKGVNPKKEKIEGKCRKIDYYALRAFVSVHVLTMGTYFYFTWAQQT